MVLIQVADTTSGSDATIRVRKVQMPDREEPEIWVHVLGGSYETEEVFDREWDQFADEEGLSFFLSLDLPDAGKLADALTEEIQDEQEKD